MTPKLNVDEQEYFTSTENVRRDLRWLSLNKKQGSTRDLARKFETGSQELPSLFSPTPAKRRSLGSSILLSRNVKRSPRLGERRKSLDVRLCHSEGDVRRSPMSIQDEESNGSIRDLAMIFEQGSPELPSLFSSPTTPTRKSFSKQEVKRSPRVSRKSVGERPSLFKSPKGDVLRSPTMNEVEEECNGSIRDLALIFEQGSQEPPAMFSSPTPTRKSFGGRSSSSSTKQQDIQPPRSKSLGDVPSMFAASPVKSSKPRGILRQSSFHDRSVVSCDQTVSIYEDCSDNSLDILPEEDDDGDQLSSDEQQLQFIKQQQTENKLEDSLNGSMVFVHNNTAATSPALSDYEEQEDLCDSDGDDVLSPLPAPKRSSSISWSQHEKTVKLIDLLSDSMVDVMFYTEDELAQQRHEAWMEECGLTEDDLIL